MSTTFRGESRRPGSSDRAGALLENPLPAVDLSLFAQVADPVIITGAHSGALPIVWVNDAFTQLTGYSLAEVTGQPLSLLHGPDTDPAVLAELTRLHSLGLPFRGEARHYGKGGTPIDLEWTSTPLRDPDGNITHFLDVCRDVSERCRHQSARLDLVRGMLEAMPVMVALLDSAGNISAANRAWRRLAEQTVLPLPPASGASSPLLFSTWAESRTPPGSPSFATGFASVLAGSTDEFSSRLQFSHGDRQWSFHLRVSPLSETDPPCCLVCLTDVSQDVADDLRAAEEARLASLKASDARSHRILESVPGFFFEAAYPGVSTYTSESCVRVLGYTPGDFVTNPDLWMNSIHPDDQHVMFDFWQTDRDEWKTDYRFRHADGKYRWLRSFCRLVQNEAGTPLVVGHTRDVTADKQTENELRITTGILENASIFVLRLAFDGRLLHANQILLSRLGYQSADLRDLHIWDLDPRQSPESWPSIVDAIKTARDFTMESSLRTRDGVVFPVEVRCSVQVVKGEPILMGFATDISQKKRAEAGISRINKTLDAVAKTRQSLLRASTFEGLYQAACDTICENGSYDLVWIGVAEDTPGKPVRVAAHSGGKEGYCEGLRISWQDDEYGRGPAGTAIRERRTVIGHPLSDPNFDVWRSRAAQAGFRCTATIPIFLPDGGLASLCVYTCDDDFFPPEEILLLEQLAGDIAYASHTLRAREAAAEAEARLRSVIASVQADIILLDMNGQVLFSNRDFAHDRYGADSAFWATLSPASQSLVTRTIPLVRAGESAQFELERFLPGQPPRYQTVHMQPVVIDGVVAQVAVSALDVTEQKLAALEIAQSEEKFRKLFESGAIAAYLHDPETGYLVDVNQKGLHDLGYSSIDEMRDFAVFDEPPYSKADLLVWLKKTVEEGRQQFEWRIPGRGRNEVWHQVYLEKVELSGKTRVLSVAVDITSRKTAERSLRLLNANLEATVVERTQQVRLQAMAMDASPDGVSILLEGRYIYMNRAHAAFYGYEPEELLGKDWQMLYGDEERARIQREIFPIIAETGQWSGETLWRRKDGSETVGEISLNTLAGGYLICTCRDLSPRLLAQAALQRSRDELALANDALARAARLKDEFLASMSHELRSPLTGILGMCEVLLDGLEGTLQPSQREALTVMEASGKHLLGVISDILDLSKIEAGRLDLEYSLITTDGLLAQAIEMMRPIAERRGQEIVLNNFAAFREVEVDVRRIRQAIINLLSNAIKFSPEGRRISLTASCSPELNLITFNVEDKGPGIPPEKQALLFKPFVQIDSSLSRAHNGTGLGLSLVRRIAELHGGGVSLRSELGKGSSFRLSIPLRKPVAVEHPKRLHVAEIGRILIGDPAPETCCVSQLEDEGYTVRVARNGHEVLALFDDWPADLVLIDLHLGDLDGFDVIRRLRERITLAKLPTRLVAITSLSLASNHAAAVSAGAVDIWFKPYVRHTLLQRISGLLKESLKRI